MKRLEQEIFEAIDLSDPIELLSELIRIPSHRGLERQEEGVARALGRYLESRGLEVRLEEVVEGRPNLICTLEGEERGRHLLLCGHTDTVPLNEGDEGVGFSGAVRKGRVEGRGSVDMKGALAAMAAAMVGLHKAGALARGKVTLAGRDLFAVSERERTLMRRRKLGFVFQFHYLLPEFSVLENVTMPARIGGAKLTGTRFCKTIMPDQRVNDQHC